VSAFDQRVRHLSEGVAARPRLRRSVSVAGIGRWLRVPLGSGPPVLALAILLLVLAVGGLPHGSASERASIGGPWAHAGAEGSCPPCRAVGGRLHGPLGEYEEVAGGHGARVPREVLVRHGIPTVLW
jgi:hypothetical protein